ncbi:capsule polysaccharide transporter [Methylobacterium nodulans]|uniref:Capsule polysaccharide export protein-like protein n=1 Tax=Methylobacterium nodulans (strain LMG 21967 / CNCM I-2342 / ORS 2060) TaxID=460265 RepID=B8IPZ8_METNO|nr:capsule polysaccharide transporter [Methylobacterium nodulans]ACL56648.1 capsule polysaccharide export protein-like protein [Methylobacterium nodulans ORS 2060]
MTVDARNPTGQPLDPAERSRLISESLRQMARVSRYNDPRQQLREARALRRRDFITPILFVALVVLPCLIGLAVFGFYLSDRYLTETHFAIRPAIGGAENAAKDNVGTSTGIPKEMIIQDTLLVSEYIVSRPMVEAIERQLPLREMFSRDSIDWFSRFDPDLPIEKLVRYWKNRVEVKLEGTSGVLSVTVNAFDPQESVAISKAILAESERMVNELTTRARQDALAKSEHELKRAEARLTELQTAVRNLRNRDGVLDAQKTNEANVKMTAQVREQRINLAVKLALLQRDLKDDARSIQDLKAQIAQLDATIARLEREATTQDPNQRRVLADALTRFEQLNVDRKNAQTFYGLVIAARERARMIADRQIEFFSVVVEPRLPQSAQRPLRGLWIGCVVAGSALAFGLAVLLRKSIA